MIKTVKTNLIWLFLLTMSLTSLVANNPTSTYIEQYKTIVLNEMDRVGIPASIKMAQAILESACGRSTLARQSNNHFGIKCGNDWTGKEVYRHDDDYKNGLLVRSCFRAYEDPSDSFMAHSNFLRDNQRYEFLFDLDIYDYKAWARGLRKAGYATDPNYSKKLINLIEKYELYLLDTGVSIDMSDEIIAQTDRQPEREIISTKKQKSKNKKPILIASKRPNSSPKEFRVKDGYYTFMPGDKMSEVAAHFKMTVKELYFRNRLAFGATPRYGEQLSIRKYIHLKNIPETQAAPLSGASEDYLFEETITISSL